MYSPSTKIIPASGGVKPAMAVGGKPAVLDTCATVSVADIGATSLGGVAGPIPIQAPGVMMPPALMRDADACTCADPQPEQMKSPSVMIDSCTRLPPPPE